VNAVILPDRDHIDLIPPDLVTRLRGELVTLHDVNQVDELRRRAAALRSYVTNKTHRKALQLSERWCELRIGELIGPGKDGRPRKGGKTPPAGGVSPDDRTKFRAMAWPEANRKTTVGLLTRDRPVTSRNEILRVLASQGRNRESEVNGHFEGVKTGDFRNVLGPDVIPDGSVDLVLTDPPYAEEFTPLWDALGSFAGRVLRAGASLISYSGQATMPDAIDSLRPHLRYWWTLAVKHRHGGQQLPGKWVISEWKPLLWFTKESRDGTSYVADFIWGSKPRKPAHKWAQGVGEAVYVIEKLTCPGDLVVDPFSGSGTVALACKQAKRRFVGAEVAPQKGGGK
jgi:site-specific DNA-methyltransferase (adenine-specific)